MTQFQQGPPNYQQGQQGYPQQNQQQWTPTGQQGQQPNYPQQNQQWSPPGQQQWSPPGQPQQPQPQGQAGGQNDHLTTLAQNNPVIAAAIQSLNTGQMPTMNTVQVIGQIQPTRSMPQGFKLEHTNNGTAKFVANLVVISQVKRQGQQQEHHQKVRVQAFGKVAEALNGQCTTGAVAYVHGRLEISKWQKNDGQWDTTVSLVAFPGDNMPAFATIGVLPVRPAPPKQPWGGNQQQGGYQQNQGQPQGQQYQNHGFQPAPPQGGYQQGPPQPQQYQASPPPQQGAPRGSFSPQQGPPQGQQQAAAPQGQWSPPQGTDDGFPSNDDIPF